jgi:hypothetical protein
MSGFLVGFLGKEFAFPETCCREQLACTLYLTSGTAVVIVYDAACGSSALPGSVEQGESCVPVGTAPMPRLLKITFS